MRKATLGGLLILPALAACNSILGNEPGELVHDTADGGSMGSGGDAGTGASGGDAGTGASGMAGDPTQPFCGDGTIDDGEECDDGPEGNGVPEGDVWCDEECRIVKIPPTCGDGTIDDGEECDDGPEGNGGGRRCDEACRVGRDRILHAELTTPTSGHLYRPFVATSGDGETVLAVWRGGVANRIWEVRGRRFARDGLPMDTEDARMTSDNRHYQRPTDLIATADGRFLLVFVAGVDADTTNTDVYSQIISSNGDLEQDERLVFGAAAGKYQCVGRAAQATGGSFLVVWMDQGTSGCGTHNGSGLVSENRRGREIEGRILNDEGAIIQDNAEGFLSNLASPPFAGAFITGLDVAASPDGGWVLAWSTTEGEVRARRLVQDPGQAHRVVSDPARDVAVEQTGVILDQLQFPPGAAEGLLIWRAFDADVGVLYGQKIDAGGLPVGDAIEIARPVQLDANLEQQLTSSASLAVAGDTYLVTWEDPRGFLSGTEARVIRARRLTLDGAFLDDEDYVINTVVEGSQQRSTATGSAEGDFFVAWDSERGSGSARLDVRGRMLPAGYRIPLSYPSQ